MKLSLAAGIAGLILAGAGAVEAGPVDPATMLCGLSAASPFEAGFEKSGVALPALDAEAAIAACREAVAMAPDSFAAKAWLARALLAAENYDEALPLLETASGAGNVLAQQLLAPGSTPSQRLAREELAQRVRRALDQMAEADREILLMRTFEGLSFEEIAYLLAIDPAAARKRHGRAILRLHKFLAEGGLTESQS